MAGEFSFGSQRLVDGTAEGAITSGSLTAISVHPSTLRLLQLYWVGGNAYEQASLEILEDYPPQEFPGDFSLEHGLHLSDALLYATARRHNADLPTSDEALKDLPGVRYI